MLELISAMLKDTFLYSHVFNFWFTKVLNHVYCSHELEIDCSKKSFGLKQKDIFGRWK